MNPFRHHVLLGSAPSVGRIFATVEWKENTLSIVGVQGPLSNGDCRGSCGQCSDAPEGFEPAPGIDAARFFAIWQEWHLNDMQAGSPAQSAFLKANPVTDRLNYFDSAVVALRAAGLQPDPGYIGRDGKPYAYGSAWLRIAVPEDVLDFLHSLPQTDALPARWTR